MDGKVKDGQRAFQKDTEPFIKRSIRATTTKAGLTQRQQVISTSLTATTLSQKQHLSHLLKETKVYSISQMLQAFRPEHIHREYFTKVD